MPDIQCLPSHVADLIAAGEVVERPASVAKELLENAIDAGSSAIVVEIQHGGLTYLRIADNGCGIDAEQLPTAFLRHATSKLRTAADLAAIGTLGFRGEALAAISAVSRVDIFSRRTGAEAGASLARVADFACRPGLAGLAFAHGIPGTVGGAVCMNAGAYGGEMAQVVREATLLLPEEGIRTLTGAEMAFGYRRSFLTDHPDAVVLRAEFCLTPGDPAAIRGRMKELLEKRRASQPLEFPSAGSTFKRPEGYYAGTLIDQCGLKGLTVGGAQVSEKHAGFVINRGGATCADVKELIRQIQERVFAQAGVRLEPEVRIID